MLHVYVFISTSSSFSFLLSCLLLFVSLFGWLVPFQLSKEAENAVNKSRGLLDDIVRENKGILEYSQQRVLKLVVIIVVQRNYLTQ